jgi:dihydrolipoamide dehydrogenase
MRNLVIIGSGPAGYAACKRALEYGNSVAVVEEGEIGGVCINKGCIPAKALIEKARAREVLEMKKEFRNLEQIEAYKVNAVRRMRLGVEQILKGAELIRGRAEIKQGKVVVGKEVIEAKNILIATGSKPIQLENTITSDEALFLYRKGIDSLVIIGGGAIGCEFAYLYTCFGTKVTLVEALPAILPNFDLEVSKTLERNFRRMGIKIIKGKKVISVRRKEKEKEVLLEDGNKVEGEEVLCAMGRKANLSIAKDLGIKIKRGIIETDEHMQTSLKNAYAAGDCTSSAQLAHLAMEQARVAVGNMNGVPRKMDYSLIPQVVYGEPEAAQVGRRTEKQKLVQLIGNGRAVTTGKNDGLIKLYLEEGKIGGASIVSPFASELIHLFSLAIKKNSTLEELKSIVYGHPTISEAIAELD